MSMLLILKGLYNTINTPLYEKKWNLGHWLVVWTTLKNMKVNWDDEIPNISWKIKLIATKPPTRTSKLSHFPTSAI